MQFIKEPIKLEFELFHQELEQALASDNPVLSDVSSYLSRSKGKELRPCLVLLSSAVFGKVSPYAIKVAAALEMLHTASLLHDDVVDESMVRRSMPSINASWNNKVAILTGDFYLGRVLSLISDVPYPSVIREIGSLGAKLSDGELVQLYCSHDFSATENTYYQIIEKKTAAMFAFSTFGGAVCSDADAQAVESMRQFGWNLGIAFQIRDDIFDYVSDTSIGKPVGNDLIEGKLTLPLIYALKHAPLELSGTYLKRLQAGTQLTVDEVADFYRFAIDNGGVEYAQNVMMDYRDKAFSCLSFLPESAAKRSLIACLDYCIARNH